MAEQSGDSGKRLVLHTSGSRADLISIFVYNEVSYGRHHAERYLAFLERELEKIATSPGLGRIVHGYPEIQVVLAKTSKRKAAHGYRIFYRQLAYGIEIIRVLHSRRDWGEEI